ncbi:hippurate hydrolase [Coccidioides immitis H538.4]|uniref:Hippurate hydrolase n=1 Tax=Coccidioides immitis H538.4 TaxID=396776 RepID=A0A0J8UFQ2_COCIT|nr:hippurate hydrolase [Coccidioides immitis H538.4]
MHACGHDMHMACLIAAIDVLVSAKSEWSGTLVIIYQPAEELGNGAIRMVNDGLYDKVPKPDVLLGQHILPQRAGRFGMRSGTVMAASDCLKITFTGRGGHASMPHRTIDPIVMAASTVVRLQTIVSREINVSQEFAVVTVGSFNAGSAPNIIPEQAEIQLNVRTTDENTRKRVLSSIDRIIKAEGEASGAIQAPQIETTLQFPLTINDPTVTQKVQQTFGSLFSPDFTAEWPRSNASEDFTVLGTSIGRPCCFWFVGCTAAEIWEEAEENGTLSDIPGNHSAFLCSRRAAHNANWRVFFGCRCIKLPLQSSIKGVELLLRPIPWELATTNSIDLEAARGANCNYLKGIIVLREVNNI